MSRSVLLWAVLSLLVVPVMSGCTGNREQEQLLLDIRNENRMQLNLLESHSEFLTRKMGLLEDKIYSLGEDTRWLDEEFRISSNRPGEIHQEIRTEVDGQLGMLEQDQLDFVKQLDADFERYENDYASQLTSTLDAMQATLDYEASFIKFVFTEQDSLNRLFATRLNARSWYESLLGTWQEKQAEQQ